MANISSLENIIKYDNSVLVYGHFSSFHHGHIRFLKASKGEGKTLIVALMGDSANTSKQKFQFNQKERASILSHIELIDCIVMLNNDEIDKAVNIIKPQVLIFGKEFESAEAPNIKKAIKNQISNNNKVKFLAGEVNYASTELLENDLNVLRHKKNKKFCEALNNQSITTKSLIENLESMKNCKLMIIGDLIIDQYSACEALGVSAEAPVIVVKELSTKNFLGGAAIIASHIKALGADPILISILGSDEIGSKAIKELDKLEISHILLEDKQRPTTFKKRYVVENQKVFRVSKLDDKDIPIEIEDKLIKQIEKNAKNCKGIIVSDFVYGVITPRILSCISKVSKKYNLFLFGDLQCSTQVGDVTKFKNFSVICPNEKEARMALKDKDSGLEIICQKLIANTSSKALILTLGAEGLIVYDNNDPKRTIRQAFPSLSVNPIDLSGAGDSLIAIVATSICSGSSIMNSAALGTCMSSIAVQNMGNKSIQAYQVKEKLLEVTVSDTKI
tara:strand:- start:477 stop:1988 length:1512 start_codon:yes stop_codon:yes gene_type:complete